MSISIKNMLPVFVLVGVMSLRGAAAATSMSADIESTATATAVNAMSSGTTMSLVALMNSSAPLSSLRMGGQSVSPEKPQNPTQGPTPEKEKEAWKRAQAARRMAMRGFDVASSAPTSSRNIFGAAPGLSNSGSSTGSGN